MSKYEGFALLPNNYSVKGKCLNGLMDVLFTYYGLRKSIIDTFFYVSGGATKYLDWPLLNFPHRYLGEFFTSKISYEYKNITLKRYQSSIIHLSIESTPHKKINRININDVLSAPLHRINIMGVGEGWRFAEMHAGNRSRLYSGACKNV